MRPPIAPSACICALAFLTACATPGDRYPTLAIRDVERAQGRFEPAPAAPLAVPDIPGSADVPLDQRLADLATQGEKAHAAFLASALRAERAARAADGDAIGSPTWAAAQVALADLDSARSLAAVALAGLDGLMVANAVQAQDIAAIESVRQDLLAKVGEEDEVLARLRSQVR